MSDFGQRLKNLRNTKGITLEQLALKLQTTKATLSRYENSKRLPDIDLAKKVAYFFGVTTDYLLGSYTKLAELVNYCREERPLDKFALDSGIDVVYLTEICEGAITRPPSMDTLKRIHNCSPDIHCLVSLNDLLVASGYMDSKTARSIGSEHALPDCHIILKYNKLNGKGQQKAEEYIDDLLANPSYTTQKKDVCG